MMSVTLYVPIFPVSDEPIIKEFARRVFEICKSFKARYAAFDFSLSVSINNVEWNLKLRSKG